MVVAANKYCCPMVWPTWPQLKIGPLIRGELDLRFYNNLFWNPGNYIDGLRKAKILLTYKKVKEKDLLGLLNTLSFSENVLVTFEGMSDMFLPIRGYRSIVLKELLRIVKPQHTSGLSFDFSYSITVHVRLGDFKPFNDNLLRKGSFNIRLPMEWIVDTVNQLRSFLGSCCPVWVFSDGKDGELRDLLRLPNTFRLHFGSALADMLAMSKSSVLVVSSTFSMWSAFLGSVPSIYYPGQLRQKLIPERLGWEVEHEWGEPFASEFLEAVIMKSRSCSREADYEEG